MELRTSPQPAAPEASAAPSQDKEASSQTVTLPKVTPAAAPAAASAAPVSFLEFPAWQQRAVAASTESTSEGSAAPPLSSQACLCRLAYWLSPVAVANAAVEHQCLHVVKSTMTPLLVELQERAALLLAVKTSLLAA